MLEGTRVLVTGGGSGIGAAMARAIAARGGVVAVNDLSEERADEVVADIAGTGGTAVAVPADVSERGSATAVVNAAVDRLGGLDGLINNVGIVLPAPLHELDERAWRQTMAVDLDSAFYCSVAAYEPLRDGGGTIVTTSSLVASAPAPGSGAYGPAKAAVLALTQQMAVEWGPVGIRANAIGPGLVSGTRFTPQAGDEELADARGRVVPLRRVARPDDIADVAVFLLSDLSRYVNGQFLLVDGGLSVGYQTMLPGIGPRDRQR